MGDALRRWDLIVLVHAAAVAAGVPGRVTRWESWALETFNDTTGIPAIADRHPVAPGAEKVEPGSL